MSNSLKFIDKEIQRINNIIRVTKNDITFMGENKRDTSQLQVKVIVLEDHLNSLNQIKTILEAWKVVKDKKVDIYEIVNSIDFNQLKTTQEDYLKCYQLNEQEYNTIKKALKVKDER